MKNFNFITGPSEKKQIEFYNWYKITLILLLISLIFIIFFHAKKLRILQELIKEKKELELKTNNFDEIVKRKNNLKDKQQKLQNKFEKLQQLETSRIFENYLISISKSIPENTYLESLDYDSKNGMNLIGYSNNIIEGSKFVDSLKKLEFVKDVKIEYLKSKEFHISLKVNS